SAANPALRYAEDDAGKLARVLVELGGFRGDDVHLLTGRPLAVVRTSLATVKAEIASARNAGVRSVLLFYFSGHSDGAGLELGNERWAFADVRAALRQLNPDIRIAIVDSCQSGALLAAKGGTPGPAFDIQFTDDLATSGEAVLTSSAAHERALESSEIRASFFSHHLISGLRGAADSSGDGRVTLGEAYRYAFVNTLLATSNTLTGPQHPAYDFQLSGRGELVLTEVVAGGATLTVPGGFDRILVADQRRQYVLAELTSTSAHRIAVPAGRYVVQGRRGDRAFEANVTLRQGESRELAAADLSPSDTGATPVTAKGSVETVRAELSAPARPPAAPPVVVMTAVAGVTRGAADALPVLGTLRLELATARPRGWSAQVDVTSGRAAAFRETAAQLGIGVFTSRRWGAFRAVAGWRVAIGALTQNVDTGGTF
ncbi:MAG: caspase family protein, partial [Pseudomonadota bacterium]